MADRGGAEEAEAVERCARSARHLHDLASAGVAHQLGLAGVVGRQQYQPRPGARHVIKQPRLEPGNVGKRRDVLEMAQRDPRQEPRRGGRVEDDKPVGGLEAVRAWDCIHRWDRGMAGN